MVKASNLPPTTDNTALTDNACPEPFHAPETTQDTSAQDTLAIAEHAVKQLSAKLKQANPVRVTGRVLEVMGTLVECSLPDAKVGDLCEIALNRKPPVLAEVVGFRPGTAIVSLLGGVEGVAAGARVTPLYCPHQIKVSDDLFGNVVDGFGRAMTGTTSAFTTVQNDPKAVPVIKDGIPATDRPRIVEPLPTQLRAIDGMITLGVGQRVGIFAGAGCGKTTLLAAIARGTPCDAIVFGLIGERGREVREFLDHELDDELKAKSVLLVATSDTSSMERVRAAFTAQAIAEGFRQSGKRVLLLIDSLTRLARAQREIGLAAGEPPGRGGFPPSVYTLLPRLIERAGRSLEGDISALYTLLIENDSMSDPIADEARSLLDGHILLSRKLAEQGHYPAIDVPQSLSRIMGNVVSQAHMKSNTDFRAMVVAYKQVEMLIKLGEYQPGNDPQTDLAVQKYPQLMKFLQQQLREESTFDQTVAGLQALLNANQAA